LALTFNKKIDIKDFKPKYARTGKNKKNSKRIFNGRNLKSNNIKKKSEHRDLFKLAGSKPYTIHPKNTSKIKKKNISSANKALDMFASQTLNPIRNDIRNLDEKIKNRKQIKFNNQKSKFSNRKAFRKTTNSNPFGLPFKPKKTIFLEMNLLKKGSSKNKKDFMPVIPLNKKKIHAEKQIRESKRLNARTKDYNVSYSNHNPESFQNNRVKINSIKSFSKVDNSVAVDSFDKFFRIFKKKKKHSHVINRTNNNSNTLTPNIYKNPKSRFKSFRQLTMQRYSKRNISKPNRKKKKDLEELGPLHIESRDVVSDSKVKNQPNFFKKNNIWSDDNIGIGENIYNPQIYKSQPEKRDGVDKTLTVSKKMENDREKFHKEYIKIDCMESDSGSEKSNMLICRQNNRKNHSREFKDKLRKYDLVALNDKNELRMSQDKQIQRKQMQISNKKNNENIYKNRVMDDTNLSYDSMESLEAINIEKKIRESDVETSEDKKYKVTLENQINIAIDEIDNEKQQKRKQTKTHKIRKVRLIDSYNLGSLYKQSPLQSNSEFIHSKKLKNMLNQKNNIIIYPKGISTHSEKVVLENLSGDWASEFPENNSNKELNYISIKERNGSIVELEDMSLQKSIQVLANNHIPKEEKFAKETRSFGVIKEKKKGRNKKKKKEYLDHILNYESEKSHKKRFSKAEKIQKNWKKQNTNFKRRSEHGIPLKISSFREKRLKGTFKKTTEKNFQLQTKPDISLQIQPNFKSKFKILFKI
jgi:hypothetical protein